MQVYTNEERLRLREIYQSHREGKLFIQSDALFMLLLIKKLGIKYEVAIKAFTKHVEDNNNGDN